MSLESVDTPALLVDLDVFERNIRACFAALEGKHVAVRPHLKTGKKFDHCTQVAQSWCGWDLRGKTWRG